MLYGHSSHCMDHTTCSMDHATCWSPFNIMIIWLWFLSKIICENNFRQLITSTLNDLDNPSPRKTHNSSESASANVLRVGKVMLRRVYIWRLRPVGRPLKLGSFLGTINWKAIGFQIFLKYYQSIIKVLPRSSGYLFFKLRSLFQIDIFGILSQYY